MNLTATDTLRPDFTAELEKQLSTLPRRSLALKFFGLLAMEDGHVNVGNHEAAQAGAEFYRTLLKKFPLPKPEDAVLQESPIANIAAYHLLLDALPPKQSTALKLLVTSSQPCDESDKRIKRYRRVSKGLAAAACIGTAITGGIYASKCNKADTDTQPIVLNDAFSAPDFQAPNKWLQPKPVETLSIGAAIILTLGMLSHVARKEADSRDKSTKIFSDLESADIVKELLVQTNTLLETICKTYRAKSSNSRA